MTTQPWQEEKLENSWVEHIVDRIYKSVGEGTFHKSDDEGGLYANRTGFIRYIHFMKDKERADADVKGRADERAKTIKECAEVASRMEVYSFDSMMTLKDITKAIENLK